MTALHSVAGALPAGRSADPPAAVAGAAPHRLDRRRSSAAAPARPARARVSLAHRGVLFLDEAPSSPPARSTRSAQPLEHGEVRAPRASGETVVSRPRFQLVARGQPVPVRGPAATRRASARRGCAAGTGTALRAAAGPGRPAGRRRRRCARRRSSTPSRPSRRRPSRPGSSPARQAAAAPVGAARAVQRGGAGGRAARPAVPAATRRAAAARHRDGPRPAVRARAGPHDQGRVDRGGPRRPRLPRPRRRLRGTRDAIKERAMSTTDRAARMALAHLVEPGSRELGC